MFDHPFQLCGLTSTSLNGPLPDLTPPPWSIPGHPSSVPHLGGFQACPGEHGDGFPSRIVSGKGRCVGGRFASKRAAGPGPPLSCIALCRRVVLSCRVVASCLPLTRAGHHHGRGPPRWPPSPQHDLQGLPSLPPKARRDVDLNLCVCTCV